MKDLKQIFLFYLPEFASRYRGTKREDQNHFGTVRNSRCAIRQKIKKEETETSSQKVFSAPICGENHRRTVALYLASIPGVAVLS